MLKDIATLIAILFVAVICIFYIFIGFLAPSYGWLNGFAYPGAIGYVNGYAFPVALTNGVIALVIFAGLMIYSGFHIKDLYSKSPKGGVVFLLIILIATLITSASLWTWFQIVKFDIL